MVRRRGDWIVATAVLLVLAAGWPARAAGTDGVSGTPVPLTPRAESEAPGGLPADLLTRAAVAPSPNPNPKLAVPLYRRWAFWAVAGALVLGAAGLTYAVTRPGPTPYYGNVGPGVVVLP